jgi:hypothetical protein
MSDEESFTYLSVIRVGDLLDLKKVEVSTDILNAVQKFALFKILRLLKELLIDENPECSFFNVVQNILSFVEIVCNDTADDISIKSEDFIISDSKLLNDHTNLNAIMDLMSLISERKELTIYYRDCEISKFKFKISSIINQNTISEVLIFFHNIRALIGTLVCQIFYLTETVKINCIRTLISGSKEIYYGLLQNIVCPELVCLIRYVNIELIIYTMKNMNVKMEY